MTYELKKNAIISSEEAPQYIQAQCELAAVQEWANHVMGYDNQIGQYSPYVSLATTLTSIDGDKVSFAADEPHDTPAVSLSITPHTMFVAGNEVTTRQALHVGDVVAGHQGHI